MGAKLNSADFQIYFFLLLLLQKQPSNPTSMHPLVSKKQGISHLTSRAQPSVSGRVPATREKAAAAPAPPRRAPAVATSAPQLLPRTLLPTSNPPQTATSSSASTSKGRGTQDLPADSCSQSGSSIYKDQQQKRTFQTALGIPVPGAVQGEPPKTTGEKHAVLHQKPEKVKQHEEKDASTTQDTTNASKEGKHLRKEETAQLEEPSCSDSGEGINMLLFLTTMWVTGEKGPVKPGTQMVCFFHLLCTNCLAIIPALW